MALTIQAIVCAVDFSRFTPLVANHAVVLARRSGRRLYLIHAVHNPQDRLHPTALFERGGDLSHHIEEAQQRIHDLMTHAAVDWEPKVCFGDPVDRIVTLVNALPPSLVISASHGVSGLRRLFIGTVVERLTRALNCPMLVIKAGDGQRGERFDGFCSTVVSCDDQGHWQQVAPVLSLLQTDSAAALHLIHAMEKPMAKTNANDGSASYGQLQLALQDRLARELKQQARPLFPKAESMDVTVAPGVPAEMVLRLARERASDLIVVGVRHSGRVGRWIAGSTTEALLRHAPCCVLTVPEPEGDPR